MNGITAGTAPVVTVFGSSRVGPGDGEYEIALRLGHLIGERGWVLCNGGYNGTMEAAARGAKESGGSTIGVTVTVYDKVQANPWLDQIIVAPTLFNRLEQLISLARAYVVLRGGIGTLLELAMIWNAVQTEPQSKPILVVGPEWDSILDRLYESLPMHPWEADSLTRVPSIEGAISELDRFFQGLRQPDASPPSF
jgi:hypothetical protein